MEVPTAAGTLDTARLGRTLMHEHVFIMSPEVQQNYPDDWGDEDRRVDDAVARLDELKANGMDTILDVTVIGLGRYIPRIQRIAARTDIAGILDDELCRGRHAVCMIVHDGRSAVADRGRRCMRSMSLVVVRVRTVRSVVGIEEVVRDDLPP